MVQHLQGVVPNQKRPSRRGSDREYSCLPTEGVGDGTVGFVVGLIRIGPSQDFVLVSPLCSFNDNKLLVPCPVKLHHYPKYFFLSRDQLVDLGNPYDWFLVGLLLCSRFCFAFLALVHGLFTGTVKVVAEFAVVTCK